MPAPSPRRLLVVMPAWNEEATVGQTLAEIRGTMPGTDVLVVNDGSTDQTSAVAAASGAMVLDLPINLGVRMEYFGIVRRRNHQLSPGAERVLEALRAASHKLYQARNGSHWPGV